MSDHLNLKHKLETLMRSGCGDQVADQLRNLKIDAIPARMRLTFANLARRVNLNVLGLKILSSRVHLTKTANLHKPSDAEIAEYAMILNKMGSTEEALRRLQGLDPGRTPEALFYQAACHLSQWNYSDAALVLAEYITSENLDPYQRSVGRLNLAAAQIFLGQLDSAKTAIDEEIEFVEKSGFKRSVANAYHLLAQIDIERQNFTSAEANLQRGKACLQDSRTSEGLFIDKWQAVVKLFKDSDPQPLEDFKAQAKKYGYWEGIRDADFYLSSWSGDEHGLMHLYFGSPFPGYRQRILRKTGISIPEEYSLCENHRPPTVRFFLNTGELEENGSRRSVLATGKKLHQFLVLLFSDFYKPQALGAIHEVLFAGEHFNIYSSPGRVHQLVLRTRRELKKSGLRFAISETGGSYHFDGLHSCQVVIRDLDPRLLSPETAYVERLLNHFGESSFTSNQAKDFLGISAAAFSRFVNHESVAPKIVRLGSGPRTRYLVLKSVSKRAAA